MPELSNLSEIVEKSSLALRNNFIKPQLLKTLHETDFISKLLSLLEVCEDLDNKEDLYLLSKIMFSISILC